MMFTIGESGLLTCTSSSILALADAVTLVTLNTAVCGSTLVFGIVAVPVVISVSEVS